MDIGLKCNYNYKYVVYLECDFEECTFSEYLSDEMYLDDCLSDEINYLSLDNKEKGVIACFFNKDSTETEYFYPPIMTNFDKIEKIIKEKVEEYKESRPELFYTNNNYWKLDVYSCVNVKRDDKWFHSNYNKIKRFGMMFYSLEINLKKILLINMIK